MRRLERARSGSAQAASIVRTHRSEVVMRASIGECVLGDNWVGCGCRETAFYLISYQLLAIRRWLLVNCAGGDFGRLEEMNQQEVVLILFQVIVLVLAFSVHESAHAWVAKRLGDPTAYMLGRVTLNPLKHLDPWGSVLVPL